MKQPRPILRIAAILVLAGIWLNTGATINYSAIAASDRNRVEVDEAQFVTKDATIVTVFSGGKCRSFHEV